MICEVVKVVALHLKEEGFNSPCLLYTSDAADDSLRVDLGGRRIIKKFACAVAGRKDR